MIRRNHNIYIKIYIYIQRSGHSKPKWERLISEHTKKLRVIEGSRSHKSQVTKQTVNEHRCSGCALYTITMLATAHLQMVGDGVQVHRSEGDRIPGDKQKHTYAK